MKKACAAIVLLAGALLSEGVTAADVTAANGPEVFAHWCAPCHAAGPGHPGTQALAARYQGERPGELEQRTDLSADVIRFYVRHGISVMPFFRKTEISDDELNALAAWLAHTAPR